MSCPVLVGDNPESSGSTFQPLGFTDANTVLWGVFSGIGLGSVPYPALTPVTLDGRGGNATNAIDDAHDLYLDAATGAPITVRVLRRAPGGSDTILFSEPVAGTTSSYTFGLHPTDGQLYGLRLNTISGVVEGLYSFDPSAGGRTTIATGLDALGKPACTEGYVWWLTAGGSVSRVPVGGGTVQDVSVGWATAATVLPGPNDRVLVIQSDMTAYWLVDSSMTVTAQSCSDFGTVLGPGEAFAAMTDFSSTVFAVTDALSQDFLYRWPATARRKRWVGTVGRS